MQFIHRIHMNQSHKKNLYRFLPVKPVDELNSFLTDLLEDFSLVAWYNGTTIPFQVYFPHPAWGIAAYEGFHQQQRQSIRGHHPEHCYKLVDYILIQAPLNKHHPKTQEPEKRNKRKKFIAAHLLAIF